MLTIKSITNGVAHITLDVDGTTYAWTVGGLLDVPDPAAHLEANADAYRADIRTALEMGRELEIIVPPTLEQAKAQAILASTAVCDAVLAPYGAEYGAYEMATWDQQYAEATAYTASPTADVPLLAAMCVARGISIAQLAGKIIANRANWVALTGYVIGQRQRIVGLIEAATSVAEVEAVDMTISLPG